MAEFYRSDRARAYYRRRYLQGGRMMALLGFGGLFAFLTVGFGPSLLEPEGLPIFGLFGLNLLLGVIFILRYGGLLSLTTQAILAGAFLSLVGLLGLVAPLWQPLTIYHTLIDVVHAYFREVGNFIGSPQLGSLLILGAGLGLVIMGVASRLLLTIEPAAPEGQTGTQ